MLDHLSGNRGVKTPVSLSLKGVYMTTETKHMPSEREIEARTKATMKAMQDGEDMTADAAFRELDAVYTVLGINGQFSPVDEIERLKAALAEARKVIEPFAEQAATHSPKMPDQMFIDDYERAEGTTWTSFANITIGQLRAARDWRDRNPESPDAES